MAEAYDAAIRRRLSLVDQMGAGANNYARQAAMRQPTSYGGGSSAGQSGGPNYNGSRGSQQSLIAFGKWLQGQGFRVSENPAFGNGRVGTHTKGSRHYSGRAIDVNFAPGTSRREQEALDRIVGYASKYGLRTIWRKPGHFNHAHFDY